MLKRTESQQVGFAEFVILLACITCFVAMAIDLMLPVLSDISTDLKAEGENSSQLIITVIFIGVGLGQIFYGPMSDTTGRKTAVVAGFIIFIVGTLVCLFCQRLEWMLIGRFLQGLGAAGPRIITMAIVRDCYHGPQMAKIMSLIMTVFIMVPVIAPILGQWIMVLAGWRAIFVFLLVMALVVMLWFGLRLKETLMPHNRKTFELQSVLLSIKEVAVHKAALAYTLALGFVFGSFLGFLSSVQQILQELYGLGEQFPYYFAILAAGVGVSNFVNSRLVQTLGLQTLISIAQLGSVIVSLIMLLVCYGFGAVPPLIITMIYLTVTMLSVGLLFGNLNTLAIEPFGHIAGLASSFIGVVSTLVAVVAGTIVGQSYNQTLIPLVAGFILLPLVSYAISKWAAKNTAS